MKMTQRMIRSIIALLIVISTLFSLSSCLIDFSLIEEIIESQNGNETPAPDSGNNPPVLPQQPSDNIGEFLPGSGDGNLENVSALQKTLLSTVIVVSNFDLTPGAGAGVIYSIDKEKGDAYILTNYHVIYDSTSGFARSYSIYLYGMASSGYEIAASFVGGSITYDFAVLKIEGSEVLKNSHAIAAELGDSESINVFDTVYAVGNPEDLGLSATRGMISVQSEHIDIIGAAGYDIQLRVIRFDASVNAGNSGGGLYDANGRLIGIVGAKRVGDSIEGMGYAIPSNLAKALADNIIYYNATEASNKLHRPLLGVTIGAYVSGTVIDEENGKISIVELVEVLEVSASGEAYGKILVGDILKSVEIDGKKYDITKTYQLPEIMLSARIGSRVTLNIERDEAPVTVSFTVTKSLITLEK